MQGIGDRAVSEGETVTGEGETGEQNQPIPTIWFLLVLSKQYDD